MTKKTKQRNQEFERVLFKMCGLAPEAFYLERYLAFWEFMGMLCYPRDEISQQTLRICAAASLVQSIERRQVTSPVEKEEHLRQIVSLEFSPVDCAIAINNLSHENTFSEQYAQVLDNMYSATCISEALLRLATVRHSDPKRNASLAKAYHFVMAGGLSIEDEWKDLEKISLATLKSYWRDYCHALPFIHAIDTAELPFERWSPFVWNGVKDFEKDSRKKPTAIKEMIEMANDVQAQILATIDKSAKRTNFFTFPSSMTRKKWEPRPLSPEQLKISRTYSRVGP